MQRPLLMGCVAVAFALCALPVQGQYVILKVGVGDGDASGAVTAGTELDNVSRPVVSPNGLIAYQGDTTLTTDDDVAYVGSTLIVESGSVAVGTGGDFDTIDIFETTRQIDINGNIVFTSTLQNVLPTAANDHGLHVNNTLVFQEGDVAPGLADVRNFADFAWPCLLDDGRVGFRADLDGSTADDFVIYFDGLPLQANATTIFREGEIIVGGPLDGESWSSTAFNELDWNNNGDVIIDADLAGTDTTIDDVLIIKRAASASYEAPLRAGDMVTTLISGVVALESFDEVKINGNGDWVARSIVDTATTEDGIVFVSLGGAAPVAILQEDGDASAVTGVPLTQFGTVSSVGINNSGDVVVHCNVDDDVSNPITYSEAVFLYSGGVLTMLFTDEITIPNGLLTDIVSQAVQIADDGRVIFEATVDGLDAIYEAFEPNVFPVNNINCDHVSGTADLIVTWDNPQLYTSIQVSVDGVLQVPDLAGTDTSTLISGLSTDMVHEVCVVGFDGAEPAPEVCCSAAVPAVPDVALCSLPGTPILDNTVITDVISVPDAINIANIYVEVIITHTFQGDLDPLSITSPTGTTVMLMQDDGGGNDNVHTIFTDAGVPSGSVGFNSGAFMQPSGPGVMADFFCEVATGDWTLTVGDDAAGDQGTLDEWCVGITAQANPALDCCPAPSDMVCSDVGPCGGGGVAVTWTNNSTYFGLELVRDDGLGGVTNFPLLATDTLFDDTSAVVGVDYTYTLEYVCASGGVTNQGPSCAVTPSTTVPAVSNLLCTPDFCANTVTVTWDDNGVAYDSLTLLRAGVFLADVTGLLSFVDIAPNAGSATYTVVGDCGGSTGQDVCVANLVFEGPTDIACASDLVTGDITVSWTNNGSYDLLELRRNGTLVVPQPLLGDTSYLDTDPVPGCNTYELTGGCGGSTSLLDCSLASFVPGNDYLMIPETTNDAIGLYDPDCGAYVGDFIVEDPLLFTFNLPLSVVHGPDDNIYVSDQNNDSVIRFDRQGIFIDVFATTGLDNIRGIDFDQTNGNLLVSDDNYIAVFDPAGTPLPNIVDPVDAFDVVTLPDGRFLVADIGVDEVHLYEADGLSFTVVVPGLSFPEQVVPLSNGNFAVMDFTADLITEFDLLGNIVRTVATEGSGTPRGLWLLNNGNFLYTSSNGVWSVDPDTGINTLLRPTVQARYIELLRGEVVVPLEPDFLRGDVNNDGNVVGLTDGLAILNWAFNSGPTPPCFVAADLNNDGGVVGLTDGLFILNWAFNGGTPPPAPFPACGQDAAAVQLLGCDTPSCP